MPIRTQGQRRPGGVVFVGAQVQGRRCATAISPSVGLDLFLSRCEMVAHACGHDQFRTHVGKCQKETDAPSLIEGGLSRSTRSCHFLGWADTARCRKTRKPAASPSPLRFPAATILRPCRNTVEERNAASKAGAAPGGLALLAAGRGPGRTSTQSADLRGTTHNQHLENGQHEITGDRHRRPLVRASAPSLAARLFHSRMENLFWIACGIAFLAGGCGCFCSFRRRWH
jgi:hypothetical protein